jgi:hypothetical protein
MGVEGRSVGGTGVYGISSSGWAGYFEGNVQITGTLNSRGYLALLQNRTFLQGFDGAGFHWFGPTPDSGDAAFGIHRLDTNDYGFHVQGTVVTCMLQITSGSDLAEPFPLEDNTKVEAGTVMVIDERHPGKLKVSHTAYDRKVAGIVSGAGGMHPGLTLQQDHSLTDGSLPVALTGRVYCWADASYSPVSLVTY